MTKANMTRGEVMLFEWRLRPSFENLVAAEAEIGSLFELIEAAGAGKITLTQMTALLWHCVVPRDEMVSRTDFEVAVLHHGLAQITPAFRAILETILAGA
jgi:Phage tail tube protein, GTA-gp10